jgi:uncharacterized repeat protein (TIGR03803 family)
MTILKTFNFLLGVVLFFCTVTEVFAADTDKILHSFSGGRDGATPIGGLIVDKGTFYGTTYIGGAKNEGVVFSFIPSTGAYQILHTFGSSKTDGNEPESTLTLVGDTLYGMTYLGGTYGNGTFFSVEPSTGAYKVLYSFGKSSGDGQGPLGGLIAIGDLLYGTTLSGGSAGDGTIFSINPSTGDEKVLYSFQGGADAAGPNGSLVYANGTLYGTSGAGGTGSLGGGGTVFSFTTKAGEAVLHSFAGTSPGGNSKNPGGSYPGAGLTVVGSVLYGTTSSGGTSGYGTLFSITSSGSFKVLHSFANERNPEAPLLAVSGTLYGTSASGGTGSCTNGSNVIGCGSVFSYDISSAALSLQYSFRGGNDGESPVSGLVYNDNAIYGTTEIGGGKGSCTNGINIVGCGAIFELIQPATSPVTSK